MTRHPDTQQDRAVALLEERGMARVSELQEQGITAATVARMEEKGLIVQLSRGLYQLPDAPTDAHSALAQAAKLVPKGVICLTSALAFHELTDTMPAKVWVAIGAKDWRPRITRPAIEFVRFGPKVLNVGVETHRIDNVPVRITSPAKTVADLFRYRRSAGTRYRNSPGLNLAIEGLREALRQRKAVPAEIARFAEVGGVWKVVEPYLAAMTSYA